MTTTRPANVWWRRLLLASLPACTGVNPLFDDRVRVIAEGSSSTTTSTTAEPEGSSSRPSPTQGNEHETESTTVTSRGSESTSRPGHPGDDVTTSSSTGTVGDESTTRPEPEDAVWMYVSAPVAGDFAAGGDDRQLADLLCEEALPAVPCTNVAAFLSTGVNDFSEDRFFRIPETYAIPAKRPVITIDTDGNETEIAPDVYVLLENGPSLPLPEVWGELVFWSGEVCCQDNKLTEGTTCNDWSSAEFGAAGVGFGVGERPEWFAADVRDCSDVEPLLCLCW